MAGNEYYTTWGDSGTTAGCWSGHTITSDCTSTSYTTYATSITAYIPSGGIYDPVWHITVYPDGRQVSDSERHWLRAIEWMPIVPVEETEEQKAARAESERVRCYQDEHRQRVQDQQIKDKALDEAKAELVAQRLIEDVFGPQKLEEYKVAKSLSVDSPSKPGLRYVIAAGKMVQVYDGNKLVDEMCVHLVNEKNNSYAQSDRSWLPDADIVVGKALRLVNDEEAFLAVANHHRRAA